MTTTPKWYRHLLDGCPPLYHTGPKWDCPRTAHQYQRYCVLADLAGFVPMPWQRLKWMLVSDPECYELVLEVGRQQGKTTSDVPVLAEPLVSRPRHTSVYSAQRGVDAERKIREEFLPMLKSAGIDEATGFRFNNGATDWGLHGTNDAHLRSMSSSKDALRGTTRVALGILDEARAERDANKLVLLVPTMTVVDDALLIVESTAGDINSVFLRDRHDKAIAALERGESAPACLIWGFDSIEGVDIESPDVWRSVLPAMGYTVTEHAIRRAFDTMEPHDFAMEYLGIWLDASMEQAIPTDVWNSIQGPNTQPTGPMVLCIDSPPEQDRTAAVVADQYGNVELVGVREGPDAPYEWAVELLGRNSDIYAIALADNTTLRRTGEKLELDGHYVQWYNTREMQIAAARFWEAIHAEPRGLAIREHSVMNEANRGSFRWIMGGEKAWVFRRQEAVNFASPLIAATLSYDAATRAAEEAVPAQVDSWEEALAKARAEFE